MANPETDRLQLVEIVPIPDAFGDTISATEGFSIEVFRDTRHLCSVLSLDEVLVRGFRKRTVQSLALQPNDTLYRINLGAKLLTLNGSFTTKNGFKPRYTIVLEIGVVDPTQFALRYRQQDDPVRLAQIALEGECQRYAAQRTQKQLRKDELSNFILHSLNTDNYKAIGISVIDVQDVDILINQPEQTAKGKDEMTKWTIGLPQPRDAYEQTARGRDEMTKTNQGGVTRMPKAVKVMQCEYCGRRTAAKLVNDIAGPGENCYECQYCFQIYRELSTGGTLLALGLLGLAIAGEAPAFYGTEEQKKISPPQPQPRHLQARLPQRVRVGERLPLQVRVALSPALDRSTPLRSFAIPPEGADVKLVLECPGFLLHSASMATVHVTPTADSDWVLFELEALHEGVHTLEISVFNGGAFLGTLTLQLTVDDLALREQSVDYVTLLPLRSPQEGEVTLVIRYDPHSKIYRYQFRSTAFGETDELHSGPLQRKREDAVADLVALLNGQARDLTGYTAEETRRWLQGKGIELWKELIPKELENLFWQQRENIKWMTILSDGDPMPWEVMYPTNDAGDDAGFLAEQFPIVRWIFGSAPTTQLQCSHPFFVVPDDAPPTAEDELTALRRIMGEGQNINDLTPLLKVFDNAEFDSLHFACHNIFRADSPTSSSIQLGSKRFVPTFLNKYNRHFHSPLIFMNACRSDGIAANYTWLAGWAKSFLAAGAGAFIGSLWEVRDSSASRFAEVFYQALYSGIALGDAMKQARTAIQNEPCDPTWLAYTLYGNPAATLIKGTSKRS